MRSRVSRREWLRSGGLLFVGLWLSRPARPANPARVEIRLRSTADGGRVWFDPIGVWVERGTIVRWVNESNVHTTTAYHPDNDHHSLRIPERARPWDSGYLIEPGDSFEVMLTEPGVYDYYCKPHEMAGMVGRIIVESPTGPGSLPFDYFHGDQSKSHWKPLPDAARASFPAVEAIMSQRLVRVSQP